MEKRIEKIEGLLLFQERVINDLSDVIVEQQKEIDYLKEQYKFLLDRIKKNSMIIKQEDEVPPPHW